MSPGGQTKKKDTCGVMCGPAARFFSTVRPDGQENTSLTLGTGAQSEGAGLRGQRPAPST
jgi:hypothetical protein